MISLLDPHRIGVHTVVGVTGEIDVATAPALRDSVLGLLNRGATSLVLDLRGVTFVDSTGVGRQGPGGSACEGEMATVGMVYNPVTEDPQRWGKPTTKRPASAKNISPA